MVENFSQCGFVTTMLDMRTSTTINGRYKEFGDYLQTMHVQHRGLLYFKAKGKRSFQTSTDQYRPVQQSLYLYLYHHSDKGLTLETSAFFTLYGG